MDKEEENAIKSLKEFAYTEYGALSVMEARIIFNLIEKQKVEIEKRDKEINQLKDELGYTRKII